ncbi:MAG: hypothetical protein JJ866_17615 [Roseibium sp.]|uniref:hypothetical protein n=1 Tax=Roseibium sp. TaxID=1936156 RepID=UPI001B2420E4|nr:hypothetical protein [Roseibium sp.]MBO6507634.1 hypothetical protein [Roseibium sp.]MBO6893765.1 hypothetical protein [Roseibium sp.]MBO6928586.1 hypothetical protein [Roseibium sp.]
MTKAFGKALLVFPCLLVVGLPTLAHADCKKDISKVEYAIDHLNRSGIDLMTAEKMRALLQDANKARKAGDEAKCQKLIDQAKYMGNVS